MWVAAARELPAVDLHQVLLLPTRLDGVRATRPKAAAGCRNLVRHEIAIPCPFGLQPLLGLAHDWYGGPQHLRISMLRRRENCCSWAGFDHLATKQHHDEIRQHSHDAEIMGDKQIAQ